MRRIRQAYYNLPEARLPASELARQSATYPHIASYYERRKDELYYDASPNSGITLIKKAIAGLHQLNHFDPAAVRHIVLAYQASCFPHDADIFGEIRECFGYDQANSFSVRDIYCTAPLMSFDIVQALSRQTHDKEELVVIVSVGRYLLPFLRVENDFFSGDGAGAFLLSNIKGDPILSVQNSMDTRVFPNKFSDPWDLSYLISMKKILDQAMRESGSSIGEIKLIIVNRTPSKVWGFLAKLLRVSEQLFYSGEDEVGHQFVNDIVVNYVSANRKGLLKPNDKYILLCLGSKGIAGCAVCMKSTDMHRGEEYNG
ncbi:hypothetical protein [Paenibacillus sp. SYP-B4298]|uniref:hypothetical protein n=1 Tax=Paenibacillus sp. SYP-B4298 TaxID=2996034 RepID=UPI0022DE2C03|nr:hypothetical protein [Paenibacillus sp. SYP-B4298]